jgi:hypothetical protein
MYELRAQLEGETRRFRDHEEDGILLHLILNNDYNLPASQK